jgi:hypothetical protein
VELSVEDSIMLFKEFAKTRQKMFEVYNKLHKSAVYVGMKNAVKEFHHSANLFSEMCDDLYKYNVELPNNSEYQDLVQKLNAIA